ncbi:3-oxoadipate enol-lactonase 2 [Roseivivax sp. THAF40]|uniref:3-oxoadipate enol-lactonase n=1 Tax=unclassified Roseivivax TaxID=2639302 RepID=UPI0012A8DA4C|nr:MULTISPECIES: 3-oxoadipate enol-lactonase [unclassified Roseivivax]QFS82827.1 3-oxoadipate enol-lactonase 2 [Roseivivax sp. THAF197b]QFT46596.1 3-oxoadipate enol-lactonase 2 [Roseivivax sp. THAF40]
MQADLGSVTLHYRIDGPDGAPWLILSNSLGADLSMWDDQIPVLTGTYRVLRYDTRGHGGSSTPEGPYSFDDLLGDVLGLMDHLGIETAAFMGLSMGGMTGLGLAIHHPDRITQVICADGRADAPEPFRAMWDERIAKVEAGGLEAIADGTLASWLTEDWRAENPERVAAIRDMVLANDPTGYIACCRALQGLDYLRHLPEAGAPILFVGGSEDKGAAPEVMQAMAEATPGGAYIAIPDAAHVANINRPEAFNIAISDVLGLSDASPV